MLRGTLPRAVPLASSAYNATHATAFATSAAAPQLGSETFGERLARVRAERGVTQIELAKKTGLTQNLISAYECDRLRLRADIVVRFAQALHASTDELLGIKPAHANGHHLSRRVARRMRQVEVLPAAHQRALLKTIDAYIRGVAKG